MEPLIKGVGQVVVASVIFLTGVFAYGDFRDQYLGLNFAVNGSNGEVTNDINGATLEYQRQVGWISMFPTAAPYQWYFDVAVSASYYEIVDPVGNLGITGTPEVTTDLKAANYILELGFSRRQILNTFMQWELGARVGGFGLATSTLSGENNLAQSFHVESKASVGLTISAQSGITWDLSKNYTLDTSFLLRKHYLSEFTVRDTISGKEFKYPDFTSFGFSVGISRGF